MYLLLQAIKDYFAAAGSGPLTTTITGGIHTRETAPSAAMPFCVMDPISGGNVHRYGASAPQFEEPLIQFTVFAVDGATALDLLENATTGLMVKFDNVTLTLSGKQHLQALRIGVPIPSLDDPEQDEQGRDVFGWAIQYQFATT